MTHNIIAHPSFIFAFVWLTAIFASSFKLVPAFSDSLGLGVVVGCSLILINLSGALVSSVFPRSPSKVDASPVHFPAKYGLLIGWAVLSVIEIAVSGGLPLVWLVTGSSKTYEDFGIPTVHGFANAIWLFLAFTQLIELSSSRTIRHYAISLGLIVWPVLVVSRALFTILLIQFVLYYVITSRRSLLRIAATLAAFLLLFSIAFGAAGDARAPEFSITEALGVDADAAFVSILWIYSYLVSPISNLAYNISTVSPEITIFPGNSLSNLLPSVVRNAIGINTGFDGYLGKLVHDAFNVGTAFMGPFYDWGLTGISLAAFLIGAVGHHIWLIARDVAKVPLLAAYGACTALTIFTNQFTQLTPLLYMWMLASLTKHHGRQIARRVSKAIKPEPQGV